MAGFVVKDGGKREQLAGGMVRDTEDGKTDYTLTLDGPMFDRWAEHLTKGARKYEPRNWMKAGESDDLAAIERTMGRYRRSAFRHFLQWFRGVTDEDHAAAVVFNMNGYEYLRERSLLLCKVGAVSAKRPSRKSVGTTPQAGSNVPRMPKINAHRPSLTLRLHRIGQKLTRCVRGSRSH